MHQKRNFLSSLKRSRPNSQPSCLSLLLIHLKCNLEDLGKMSLWEKNDDMLHNSIMVSVKMWVKMYIFQCLFYWLPLLFFCHFIGSLSIYEVQNNEISLHQFLDWVIEVIIFWTFQMACLLAIHFEGNEVKEGNIVHN